MNTDKIIKAVIIDDEPNSRELLQNMLLNYCKNVEVLGEAHDVPSGIDLINSKKPSLVFLDIEMPGGQGFEILNAIEDIKLSVIFVTGYNNYAIKAIKYSALDYLLKPVELGELRVAVNKASQREFSNNTQIEFLSKQLPLQQREIDQIVLPDRNYHVIVNLDQIVSLEAEGNYVTFHLENKESKIVSYPLSHYEQILPKHLFYRVHKSHIVNLQKVVKYEKGRAGTVLLSNGQVLDIAARRKAAFIKSFSKLHEE